MKKIFAIFAIASMVMVGCSKDDTNQKKGGNKNKEEKQEPEYVAPVTIDGNFADWAALDASKVATATLPDGAAKEALKVLKVYADELYVYMYFEWDTDMIEYEPDVEHVPFHIYINSDGDATTGGFSDQWSDACMDVCFEGFLTDGTNIVSYEGGAYPWEGEPNGSGWGWGEGIDAAAGLFAGAGVLTAGKYELSITRELFPIGKLADNFSLGCDIQQSWDSVGYLPIGEEGTVPSLQVVTVK